MSRNQEIEDLKTTKKLITKSFCAAITGTGNSIKDIYIYIYDSMKSEMSAAIVALHSFTGNTKQYQCLPRPWEGQCLQYQGTLSEFRDTFTFYASLFPIIKIIVREIYDLKSCNNPDDDRYLKIFSGKKRKRNHRFSVVYTGNVSPCINIHYV